MAFWPISNLHPHWDREWRHGLQGRYVRVLLGNSSIWLPSIPSQCKLKAGSKYSNQGCNFFKTQLRIAKKNCFPKAKKWSLRKKTQYCTSCVCKLSQATCKAITEGTESTNNYSRDILRQIAKGVKVTTPGCFQIIFPDDPASNPSLGWEYQVSVLKADNFCQLCSTESDPKKSGEGQWVLALQN